MNFGGYGPVLKTGIIITVRGIAISAYYISKFKGAEIGPGPGEVDGIGRIIGPAPPTHRKWRKACINICKHILKF